MSLRKYFERAEWIWLDSSRWPEAQTGRCTTFGEPDNFAAASFYREFEVPDSSRVRIRVSADCKYMKEYISRLTEVFAEVRRVLRSDGTLWLNISDTYAGKVCRNWSAL